MVFSFQIKIMLIEQAKEIRYIAKATHDGVSWNYHESIMNNRTRRMDAIAENQSDLY